MEDFLKVLFGIFIGFMIGFTSMSGGYFEMQRQYFQCQIDNSGKIEFQSGFAEWLFQK